MTVNGIMSVSVRQELTVEQIAWLLVYSAEEHAIATNIPRFNIIDLPSSIETIYPDSEHIGNIVVDTVTREGTDCYDPENVRTWLSSRFDIIPEMVDAIVQQTVKYVQELRREDIRAKSAIQN